jgi:hypothetical protein
MPTPSPEHKKLGFWIGTWKIEAEGKETPLWPAGKYNATMTAEWFEGEFFGRVKFRSTVALGYWEGRQKPSGSEIHKICVHSIVEIRKSIIDYH